MERFSFVASGISGFVAVLLGAFGAHGLRSKLDGLPDGVKRLEWWTTAAHYQIVHALALAVCGYLATRTSSVAVQVAAIAFVAGTVLFSGSLYTMTLTGVRTLGAVTPLGGLGFLVGWASLVVAALQLSPRR